MKKTSEFTPSQTRVEHVAAASSPTTQSAEMPASKPNIFRRLLQILFLANLNVQHVHCCSFGHALSLLFQCTIKWKINLVANRGEQGKGKFCRILVCLGPKEKKEENY